MLVCIQFFIRNGLEGTIDIPEQGASSIPLSKVTYKYPKIHFELESDPNTVVFESTIDKGKISGTVTQGQATGQLSLERIDA